MSSGSAGGRGASRRSCSPAPTAAAGQARSASDVDALIARGERLAPWNASPPPPRLRTRRCALSAGVGPARIICSASFTNTKRTFDAAVAEYRAAIARRHSWPRRTTDSGSSSAPGIHGRCDREFEQAINIRPSLFDATTTSARPYGGRSRWDRARAVLGRAVALRPAPAEARLLFLPSSSANKAISRRHSRSSDRAATCAEARAAHTQLGAALQLQATSTAPSRNSGVHSRSDPDAVGRLATASAWR